MPRSLTFLPLLALAAAATGCGDAGFGSETSDITDVKHTPVERQSIGNCWLYAQASWIESMNYTATGEAFDVSQSYWTYWHWFDQIRDGWSDKIETGGSQWVANGIIRERGLMAELDFVAEDATNEMSFRQKSALDAVNLELDSGRLSSSAARADGALVRDVLDEAWGLSGELVGELDAVFGEDGGRTLDESADPSGSTVIAAEDFPVAYTARKNGVTVPRSTHLGTAMSEWRTASYPSSATTRRSFQIRVQRALHDRQPVVITWNVDFNAMENGQNELRGSFNLKTLANAGGPGRQGGHMTVLEDYEAVTQAYGVLAAGVTLDPSKPEDAKKLEAALASSTTLRFFRIKNSWGSLRDDRAFAPGFPGYHDLYSDYLNGPIRWCPSVDNKTTENCTSKATPLRNVILPPGY
jgi:hypothetical protein